MKPTTFLLGSLMLLCATLFAATFVMRPPEPLHHVRYGDTLNARLDDMLRRTCDLYKRRVAEGRMKAGEPEFADCP